MKKKIRLLASLLTVMAFVIILTNSCKKEENSISTLPKVILDSINEITLISAKCFGEFRYQGGSSLTERGVCLSIKSTPTIADTKFTLGSSYGKFNFNITGLTNNTKYFVRAYTINAEGTTYGNILSFTTLPFLIPVLTTSQIGSVTTFQAISGGNITSSGSSAITERGVCWSTETNPTINDNRSSNGTGIGNFSSTLIGLYPNKTYFVRGYATNSEGTGYGNEISFNTINLPIVTDIDGNVYHIITIGTQEWMVENLKVTKYRNGDPIPNVSDSAQWIILSTGAYCDYENTASNSTTYGKLYNWFAIDDSRNIAPSGWHVATHLEWNDLVKYLGGCDSAGVKLKEAGLNHWHLSLAIATNESGFTALPGGRRHGKTGKFYDINLIGHWWTSTQYDSYSAFRWAIALSPRADELAIDKKYGYSVRCIKDK